MAHQFEMHGSVLLLRLRGKINSNNAQALEDDIQFRLDQGVRHMIMDMAEVDYMSSAGLRILLLSEKQLRGCHGKLVLCHIGEAVREVLDISGFLGILTIVDSVEIAADLMERE